MGRVRAEMDESLPEGLCIRGTFIDLDRPPDSVEIPPKRSSSAPPRKYRGEEDVAQPAQKMELPVQPCFSRQVTAPVTSNEDELAKASARSGDNPNEARQALEQEEGDVICRCGVPFVSQGFFCYNCGSAKKEILAHVSPRGDMGPSLKDRALPRRVVQSRASMNVTPISRGPKLKTIPLSYISSLDQTNQATPIFKEKVEPWADIRDEPFAQQCIFEHEKRFSHARCLSYQSTSNATSDLWETATVSSLCTSPYASEHTTLTLSSLHGSPSSASEQESVRSNSQPGSVKSSPMQRSQQKNVVSQPQITTLMICDIPCRQTISKVIAAINEHGFSNTYDLVYLPPQKGRRKEKNFQNIGYAFVNFKKHEHAAAFARAFENYSFPGCQSTKLSYTKPANVQGFEANLAKHSQIKEPGCLFTFRDA